MADNKIQLTEEHFHSHIKQRMSQRGITREEIEQTLDNGKESAEAKPGTYGKIKTFRYNKVWEGSYYDQKQITVYYKKQGDNIILLTAIARFGEGFE